MNKRILLLIGAGLAALLPMTGSTATNDEIRPVHAIAMHGAPKYGPDFKHFDYVNPYAPKGGMMRTAAQGTFDSFNSFIDKGNPAGTGSIESLLTSSSDEPFTEYGLIADQWKFRKIGRG